MAEAVGLALGVVALAGVMKDCIDLFSDFAAANSMGRDYEILNTKLDIEKALLMQWAKRTNLFERDGYDRRLDEPKVCQVVSRTLASIKLLLSEGQNLQKSYGIIPAKRYGEGEGEGEVDLDVSRVVPVLSNQIILPSLTGSSEMDLHLSNETKMLGNRIYTRGKNTNMLRKARWVVRDKEKFDGLIQELSHFISRLNTLVPDRADVSHSGLRETLANVRNVRLLQLISEAAAGTDAILSGLAQEAATLECRRRILERLWFRNIDERIKSVACAHAKTYQWALRPPNADTPWDDLSEWFKSGDGIYWICGKAGSGKSTLMKYLFQHARTKEMLEVWAEKKPLVMASFFLWNLGSAEQKTQMGLARGLLYSLLDENRHLIRHALPKMWREVENGVDPLELPSMDEIKDAFAWLGSNDTTNVYCFFIDGVDEYSGNYMDGINFIKNIVSSSRIKALISSRPIDVCVDSFSSYPKLLLQDLTKGDIRLYIEDSLCSHSYMKTLMELELIPANKLLDDLRVKASGVFLWVVLACRSLLEGFAACDYIEELQRRVDELPPELEDLFRHILTRISPRYTLQAAKLLRVCYQSALLPFQHTVSTLALALVDEQRMRVSGAPRFVPLTMKERKAKCEIFERRLQSRCRGLLEIHIPTIKGFEGTDHLPCVCGRPNVRMDHEMVVDSCVSFMHRTVFEFLDLPGVWNLDYLQVHDDTFNANTLLSCMTSQLVYHSSLPGTSGHMTYLIESLEHAKLADEPESPRSTSILLHLSTSLLSTALRCRFMDPPVPFFKRYEDYENMEELSLILAVESGMTNFVKESAYLPRLQATERRRRVPLLYHAFLHPHVSDIPHHSNKVSLEMIKALLHRGCDLNEIFVDDLGKVTTPWKSWLTSDQVHFAEDPLNAALVTEKLLLAKPNLGPIPGEASGGYGITIKRLEMIIKAWLTSAGPHDPKAEKLYQTCDGILKLVGRREKMHLSMNEWDKELQIKSQDWRKRMEHSGPNLNYMNGLSRSTLD